jgi:hypothetical protein
MNLRLAGLTVLAALACSTGNTPDSPENRPAAMTDSSAWRTLFDGTSTAAWRGYQMDSFPAGWGIEGGSLVRTTGGVDIITRDQFSDFELELEWKVGPAGNSGIMYRVTEADSSTYRTGPEYQILDDAAHQDGKNRLTSAGSAYGLYAPPAGVVKPAGEWNSTRIVARGAHVEHWLNGQKVVEYELWSPDWEEKVRNSKFVEWSGYGRSPRGHIALQDHGDRVEFRAVRIRELRE